MDSNDKQCIAIHETTDKCNFYKTTPACQDEEDGYFDYMYLIFCALKPEHSWIGIATCLLWLMILFIALGVTADDFLCPSLVVITKTLHLSQNIAGVTFLAFGNGAPDIFSSVASANQDRPGLVIGTLFGAGVFVTSVVVGSIIATKPFKIMERPFLRDIIFYLCASFFAFLIFYYEEINLWEAIGFIVLYIIYILVVVISRLIYNRYKDKNAAKLPEIEIQSPDTPDSVERKSTVTFKPNGEDPEDDPEAEGVVLRPIKIKSAQPEIESSCLGASDALSYAINSLGSKGSVSDESSRFSFRGSISVPKKRPSSSHAHHEHVIKALTKSVENHPNPVYKNGHPPPLDSQISKTSLSSLLSSNGHISAARQFIYQISPIDIEEWPEKTWYGKIFEIIKTPVCFLLIITVPVVDYENDKNNWCRPLNIIHCVTSPMFILFALQKYDLKVGTFPVWSIILISSLLLAVLVFCTSSNDSIPIYHGAYGYLGFITSVMWVYVTAQEIVSLLKTIGIVFKLSDAILGLTVLAWGNSIGDFISNLSVARQGYPRMGISACYGGPLLNLLLGIGIPFTILLAAKDKSSELEYERLITLLYSSITIILLTTLITMTALRFNAKRFFGFILIGMYLVFLVSAILLETNVI